MLRWIMNLLRTDVSLPWKRGGELSSDEVDDEYKSFLSKSSVAYSDRSGGASMIVSLLTKLTDEDWNWAISSSVSDSGDGG